MALHDRTRRSGIYQQALKMAMEYLRDPDKMDGMLNRAGSKADQRRGKLSEAWQQVQLLIAMLKSYRSGEYRDISQKSLMLMVAALLYFVMPADLIPDILVGFGFLDDAALIAWTISALKDDIDKFDAWRKTHNSAMGAERARASRSRGGTLIEGELAED